MDLIHLAIIIFVVVYSCILHECAHVWTALKLGDPTGKALGRLTLNPLPHISIFWTILLPILTYLVAHFPIGGPKPAPVNLAYFRKPRRDFMLTAMAGPATNLLIASAAFGLFVALHALLPKLIQPNSDNAFFFFSVIFINTILMAINLIPVPPLDGSRLLHYLLGRSGDRAMFFIERFGFIPIFLAFYFLAPYVIYPFVLVVNGLLNFAFDEEYVNILWSSFLNR